MPSLNPADELASLRAEIARLRARERALCDALAVAPPDARTGQWVRADVAMRSIRLFDHRLLPPEIRENPLYWCERHAVEVSCHPVDALPQSLSLTARIGQAVPHSLGLQ